MAPLFNRVLLYFALSVPGAFGCALAAPTQAGLELPTQADDAYSAFSTRRTQEPPLRLALALDSSRRAAPSQRFDIETESVALRMSQETRTPQSSRARRAVQPESAVAPIPAPVSTPAPAAAAVVPVWEVMPADRTLNNTLARWAASAGWQLVWDLEVDFPIEARAVLSGSFEEAIGKVAQSMSNASLPIQATFYAGNRVLRIVAKGSK